QPTLTPDSLWTGPTLMSGSADASVATTSLTSPLRSGDYQIGHHAQPTSGYPAGVELYRDATFALALSRRFDQNRRMTLRADRVGEPFDSVRGSSVAATGGFWQNDRAYDLRTAAPLLRTDSATTTSGTEAGFATFNDFFEQDGANGYGGGSDGFAQETMTRDAAGRVTELRRRLRAATGVGTLAADNVLSTYTYRPDGRLARLGNPDGTHDFTYDSRGLMQTQTVSGEGTYTYGYDEMGRNSFLEYPDGHSRAQTFDDLGRITSRCYAYSLGTTRCYTADYDAVGNPVRMTDPDGEDVFEYDALDRLKKVTRRAPAGGAITSVEDYAYNALGALKVNAGVTLDDQRPRLSGGGTADAAVPATLGGQPVTLDAGGFVTSLRGASLEYSRRGFLKRMTPPLPERGEFYAYDSSLRRVLRQFGDTSGPPPAAADVEFYVHEGLDRVATIGPDGATREGYLFDGIDHPLRMKRPATSATIYFEVDLAGNVRALRASGGASVGGYRYSAFGKLVEDSATIDQPLRWKGRWYSPIAGGTYDVRARQWAPEAGVFLSVDDYEYHSYLTTLWGWPGQSPTRRSDPSGHNACEEDCAAKFKKVSDECTRKCGDAGASCYLDCTEVAFRAYTECLKGCKEPPPPPPSPKDPCAPPRLCPASCGP
ncbi:MAG: hypothetical protein JST00_34505, partial [Deltaproteobacteria bacterium]|nr:hypothetical protein [Deltaproteobacteria bacterium]